MFGKSATEATSTTSEENGGEGVGGRRGGHICREAKGMWRLGGKGADSRSLDLLADERHVEAALPSFNGRFGWRKCRRRSFGKPPSISFLSWWWAGGGGVKLALMMTCRTRMTTRVERDIRGVAGPKMVRPPWQYPS